MWHWLRSIIRRRNERKVGRRSTVLKHSRYASRPVRATRLLLQALEERTVPTVSVFNSSNQFKGNYSGADAIQQAIDSGNASNGHIIVYNDAYYADFVADANAPGTTILGRDVNTTYGTYSFVNDGNSDGMAGALGSAVTPLGSAPATQPTIIASGTGTTVTFASNGVSIDNLNIVDGNGFNPVGVLVSGNNNTITNSTIQLHDRGVVVNAGVNGLAIANSSIIDNTQEGIRFNGGTTTQNVSIHNDFITGNVTSGTATFAGVRFAPTYSGNNVNFFYDDLSGNGGSGAVLNQSLITNNASRSGDVNFSFDWFGSASGPSGATISGIAAPGTGAKVSNRVDISPYLVSGDADGDPTNGFQPSLGVLNVTKYDVQTGTVGRIQEAVTGNPGTTVGVNAGGIINVAAGTFAEAVTVPKAVSLRGANFGINPNTQTRNLETIVPPSSGNTAFTVSANGVTIDGFTLDGQSLSGTNGVASSSGFTGLMVSNDIIQNFTANGVSLVGFQNATITTDKFNNNATGLFVSTGIPGAVTLSNSTITGGLYGVNIGPGVVTATGNTISNLTMAGFNVSSGHLTAKSNVLSGNAIGFSVNNGTVTLGSATPADGNTVDGGNTSVSVSGGTISSTNDTFKNATTGVGMSGGSVSLTSDTIQNDTTGINATGGTLTVGSGDTVTGGLTGLLVSGGTAAITGNTLNNLAFSGQTGSGWRYITLTGGALSGLVLNATGASFDGFVGGSAALPASLATFYAKEDRIDDYIDAPGVGFVRLKSGNVFVTQQSDTTTAGSIQRGVNAALAAETVHVQAGTFDVTNGVTLARAVTLEGANAGVSGTGSRGPESILTGPSNQANGAFTINTTNPVVLNGFAFNGAKVIAGEPIGSTLTIRDDVFNLAAMTASGATNMIVNSPNRITLTDNHFTTTGFNPSNSAVLQVVGSYAGGADTTNDVEVTGNTFTGIGNFGTPNPGSGQSTLQLNLSSVQGNVAHNVFDGVDIGVLVSNNTGNLTIDSNTFQNITRGASETASGSFGAGVLIYQPAFTNGPVTISNNTFQNSDSGIRVSSAGGTLLGAPLSVTGNTFTGNTYAIVDKLGTGPLTPSGTNIFDGVTLGSATLPQLYAIENNILDAIDVSGYGLVRLKAGNIYVTSNSFFGGAGTTTPSIQRGVDAASANDIVNVQAGTYTGDVDITKTLTLLGAQAGVDPVGGRVGVESVIMGSGANAPVQIDPGVNNVTIDGFTVESPAGGSGNLNSGIWTNGSTGVAVQYDIIQNNTAGIGIGDSAGTIAHNVIQNNNGSGPGSGSGVEFFGGGSGGWSISNNYFTGNDNPDIIIAPGEGAANTVANVSITNNQFVNSVGNALLAINADHLTFSGNQVTGAAFSGVVIDGEVTNSSITGNTFTNGHSRAIYAANTYAYLGYGPNSNVTVSGNTITQDARLLTQPRAMIDLQAGAGVSSVSGNTITITNGAAMSAQPTTGFSLTGDSTTVTGNSITGATTGIAVDNGTLTIGAGNTLSGGTTGLLVSGGSSAIGGDTLNDLTFSGQSGDYVDLENGALFQPGQPTRITAGGATFDGVLGSSSTNSQLSAIEAKIHDYLADPTLGYINVHPGVIIVTNGQSIQAAVNLASPGDTIFVEAGTYHENVIVNKTVTLDGPNDTYNPNTNLTPANPQAILEPTTTGFTVTASNVTIEGFTIDGGPGSAATAISVDSANGATITSNLIENFASSGVVFDPSSGGLLQNNLIENVGTGNDSSPAVAVLLNNAYASVLTNVITSSDIDVEIENLSAADPGTRHTIGSNSITYAVHGMVIQDISGSATAFSITSNTITSEQLANVVNDGVDVGLMLLSIGNTAGETISGNTINLADIGVFAWNNATPLTITGGTIENAHDSSNLGQGVFVSNVNFLDATPAATNAESITLDGVALVGNDTAVQVFDNNSAGPAVSVGLTNGTTITIPNHGVGLLVDGANASIAGNTLNDTAFTTASGQAFAYIQFFDGAMGGQEIDGTTASFDGFVGGTAPVATATDLAKFYAVEDLIGDALDTSGVGFVRLKDGYVFLAQSSEVNAGSLQRAVNVATAGDTIFMQAGSFQGGVDITTAVTIDGAQAGVDARTRSGSVTIVTSDGSDPLFTVQSDLGSPVTLDGLTLDGQGVAQDGIFAPGSDSDPVDGLTVQNDIIQNIGGTSNAIGVSGVSGVTGLTVQDNLIHDIGLNGISATGGTTSFDATIQDNHITNVNTGIALSQNEYGLVSNNLIDGTVSQGITADTYSTGNGTLEIDTNNVSASTTGISLNNVTTSGTFEVTNNIVTGSAGTTGISFSGLQSGTYTVSGNSVTGGNVGESFTDVDPSVGMTVSGDMVTGAQTGFAILSQAQFGSTFVTLSGVDVSGATTGVSVVSAANSCAAGVSITGSSIGVTVSNGTGVKVIGGGIFGASATVSGNTAISIVGAGSVGVYASDASLDLEDVTISSTSGDLSQFGVKALYSGLTMNNVSINMNGAGTIGVYAYGYSSNYPAASLSGVNITITGTGSRGVDVENGAAATLDDVHISLPVAVDGGWDIYIAGGALEIDTNVSVTGGDTGLRVNDAYSAYPSYLVGDTLSTISFSNVDGNYINLLNGALDGHEIDATHASFDGFVGANATLPADLATFYAKENRISDYLDAPGVGFVRLQTGEVFVTPLSESTTAGAIQRAVDVALDGDTVDVQGGTYSNDASGTSVVNINKGVSVVATDGPAATTIDGNAANGNYYVVTISASNATLSGFTITNAAYAGTADASGVLIESPTTAHLSNVRVTGNVIHDIGSVTRPSAFATLGINAEEGIDGLQIDHNTIYNIGNADASGFAIGILTAGDPGQEVDSANIHDNTIYNVSNPSLAAAIDAGSSSQNFTIQDNVIGVNGMAAGPVGYGIRTSSAASGPINISSNVVANASVAGIDLNSPFAETVHLNTVSGSGVGLEIESGGVLTSATNNLITGNGVGVLIASGAGSIGPIGGATSSNGNSINGNTTAGLDNESSQTVDARNNWWGNANGPTNPANTFNVGHQGDSIIGPGTTNYVPWLTSGQNDAVGPGFVPHSAVSFAPVTNSEGDGFSSIQAAVNGSPSGDTIFVSAGTFHENVTVNKALTIDGANAGTAGSNGGRGAESIVVTNGNNTGGVFNLSASNIIIDGFTIEGDDPAVTGGKLTSGADANATYGFRATGAFSQLTVENNIVKDVAIGFRGDGSASNNLITRNWFDSIGFYDFGYAVSLRTNFYADVTNNLMTRVQSGLHTTNFFGATGPATWLFQGNTVSVYGAGVWDNLQYNHATSLTIDNNHITSLVAPNTMANSGVRSNYDGNSTGILLVSIQDTVGVNITNNVIDGMGYGLIAYNTVTSNTVTVGSTNTIENSTAAGVYLTNIVGFNPVSKTELGGDPSNVPPGFTGPNNPNGVGTLALSGLALTNNATGVLVRGDNAFTPYGVSLTVGSGDSISGGTTGLAVTGSNTAIAGNTLGNLSFSGQTNYIVLSNSAENGQRIDATGTSFDGLSGATATLSQLFGIEDKITHSVDTGFLGAGGVGFVRVKAGNVYVTQNSGNIQYGVDSAAAGDTVNVQAGSYPSAAVTVNKALTILGQGSGTGGTVLNTTGNAITVAANNVTLQGLRIVGNGSSNGVYFDSVVDGTTLNNVVSTGHAQALEVHNNARLTNLTLTNVDLTNSTIGMRLGTTGQVSGMTVTGGNISGNQYGLYTNADLSNVSAAAANEAGFQHVTFNGTTFAGNDAQRAMYFEKLNDVTFTNVTVTANKTGTVIDVNLKNGVYSGLHFNGGSITDAAAGTDLYIKGRNDGGNASKPGSLTGVTLNNETVSSLGTDLAFQYNVTLDGSTFSGLVLNGSGTGIGFFGSDGASATDMPSQTLALNDTSFAGSLATYVVDTTHNNVDGTAATYGGIAGGNTLTVANGYAITDKIVDGADASSNGFNSLGYVRLRAGQVYVTPNSFYAPLGTTTPSIQRGVTVANANDTVNVKAGTYTGDVDINKALTLLGAQAEVDPVPGRAGAESIIMGTGANAPVQIDSGINNVVIDGFTIQSPAGGSGSLNAGIWTNGSTGLTIRYDIIQNNTAGIGIGDSGGSIAHNVIRTNNGPGAGSGNGVEFFTGSGSSGWTITNNLFGGNNNADIQIAGGATVSNVVITANQFVNSTGNPLAAYDANNVTFSGNSITGAAFSGVNLGGGVTNSTISGNTFTDDQSRAILAQDAGYGTGPNVNVTISANTITQNAALITSPRSMIDLESGAGVTAVTGNTITVSNLTTQQITGIGLNGAGSVLIQNNTINGAADGVSGVKTGISVGAGSTATLLGNTVHGGTGNGRVGIAISGTATLGDDTAGNANVITGWSSASADGVQVTSAGAATLLKNTINGNNIGVLVDGGKALLQDNDLQNNKTNGVSSSGVDIRNNAMVDLGQGAGGTNFTGLGISMGGNVFNWSATPAGGYASTGAKAIVNENDFAGLPSGTAPAQWPNVPAQFNNFGTTVYGNIEQIVFHYYDSGKALVDYRNAVGATAPQLEVISGSGPANPYLRVFAEDPASFPIITLANQRSIIRAIQFQVDSPVALGAGAVDLTRLGGTSYAWYASALPTGAVPIGIDSQIDGSTGRTTVTIRFTTPNTGAFNGSMTEWGSLIDGNYNLGFHGAAAELLFVGSGSAAQDHTDSLFRFFGDTNGSRTLNAADTSILNQAKSGQQPAFVQYFDLNQNGTIDPFEGTDNGMPNNTNSEYYRRLRQGAFLAPPS